MRPRGARLGLGQGFRNAPLESPVKAGAGLEECSSRELREREEAGWGRAGGMFPQSTPLTLEAAAAEGLRGGKSIPPPDPPTPPLRLQDGCGSGFRAGISILPTGLWAALGSRQGRRRRRRGEALLFLSKKTLHHCFVSPAR